MSTEDFAAVRTRVWSSLEHALEGGSAADHVAGVRRALAPHLAAPADDTAESAPAESLSDADRTTLELVIRMFLDDLLRRAKESKAVLADAKVPELLDLTLELTRQGVPPAAPISPTCRTPLFPYLTFYSCFQENFSRREDNWPPRYSPRFSLL